MNTTSLNPPISVSLALIISTFHLLRSAYLVYILNKLAANKAASSPPAPPLTSINTFLSSLGSLGNNNILISSLAFSHCSVNAFISS